jgi:DNA segregation ATPase FtsK/SpoIIIE-like protein
VSQPDSQGTADSQAGDAAMLPGEVIPPNGSGASLAEIPDARPVIPEPNPEPLKRRIHHAPRRGILAQLKRRPSEEDRIYRAEKAKRRAMEKLLRDESSLFMDRITNALNRRGLCYRYPRSQRDFLNSGVRSVRFDVVVMQPDAIYLRINTHRLPQGVGIMQLVDPDILTDLSLACGRRISAEYSEKVGCWYIIERATGVRGIPTHVKLNDMLASFPASADGLSIPLGQTANSKPVYRSLGQIYSMLVGGTIGSGKSNILNVILCSLIRRNPPDRLKLLLVDLKGGLEFSFYEGIPHLLSIPEKAPGGIVYYRQDVPDLLAWLIEEGERRIELIKRAGYKDIARYNQYHRKNHLPHLVLVIDEWADIKLERETGKVCEARLTNIASRFRAVGIHVVICTQVPKAEVISVRIKGVLPAKLAFSCPTNQASMAILDNGHAKELQPEGRYILQWQREMELQAPYITDQFIRETVDGAKAGKYDQVATGHDVTALEVMGWALENDSGFLSRDRLFQVYRNRGITLAELATWLAEWEGEEFVIGSSLYRVEPANGNRARRLVAVVGEEEKEVESAA